MVTKTEETQLNRLENQVDNGGGGAWDYLCLVRKLKVRRSEKVLKHGLSILNDPKRRSSLGADGASSFATDLIFIVLILLRDSLISDFMLRFLELRISLSCKTLFFCCALVACVCFSLNLTFD